MPIAVRWPARLFLVGVLLVCASVVLARVVSAQVVSAQTDAPDTSNKTDNATRYTVSFSDRAGHYLTVEAEYPTGGADELELMMAVWTPGSYLLREYAQNVEGLVAIATDGTTLPLTKTRKNRWTIESSGYSRITCRYRVYCRKMSVQANWVEDSFAIINGAPTFIARAEALDAPFEVLLVLPEDWRHSVTGLAPHASGRPHHYQSPDFDTLVDCPIYGGNATLYEFDVAGKPHVLLNHGEGGVWDGPRSAADVEAIVKAQHSFWGQLPYERYVFFNLITESGGGLEHKNSTLMLTSRWRTRDREAYTSWLGLVSHEFFHTWNVKRLRPRELGPFDYERENHTRGLWFAEGFTSYYDDLLLRRARLIKEKEYLKGLSKQIERLQTTPGRKVHPLSETSFDTWIKFYRRNENTKNTTISYYTKGAVVAFLLDARIRAASSGTRSLDDLMRLLYDRYSGATGFTSENFRDAASETAGADLHAWLAKALDTTDELDYTEALAVFGLRFKDPDKNGDDEGDSGNDGDGDDDDNDNSEDDDDDPKVEEPEPAWLGLETTVRNGRLVVTAVLRETPAYDAGFQVDDEILAIDDYRVPPKKLGDRLERYQPGDSVSVLVARREKLQSLGVVFGEEPPKRWRLERDPDASEESKRVRESWLTGP